MKNQVILFFLLLLSVQRLLSQTVSGVVKDAQTGDVLIGATVAEKGTTNGTSSDASGKFSITVKEFPATLSVSYIGYTPKDVIVKDANENLNIKLTSNQVLLHAVQITGSRLSEKAKQSPLTVESMDQLAIKETPAFNFYEGLGHLKGVDITSASLAFKIINTRGFNSTSPVRSLQLIDGVDNQAPGLNFSLGNFLGAPDLDVLQVDLIEGASSAFYGPNAFNGVISMTTKDPFQTPGLDISIKGGERNLLEGAARWDQVFRNKNGEEKFAYKINIYALRADDWQANNLDPVYGALDGKDNPGGYDAVNRYGDEFYFAHDYSGFILQVPGLGRIYRDGYLEKDLVDYGTHNYKGSANFQYKIKPDVRLILASSFGSGTTIYQGDNRYALKNILFFQNRIELQKPDKYFIRAYATNENSGDSYDAYFTALLLENEAKSSGDWGIDYFTYYSKHGAPAVKKLPGYPKFQFPVPPWYYDSIQTILNMNPRVLDSLHMISRQYANDSSLFPNQHARFVPGTPAFDSALHSIITRESYSAGGTHFFDRSALYHVQGEYKFTPSFMDITTGGNFRLYAPNSHGTIFSDTNGRKITDYEYGIYAGAEKKLINDQLKLNVTCRMDKNENFNYLFSPAASAVYSWEKHVFRVSFSSAIRNPTLADQYLYYNVGRAILVGNLHGFDSLVTLNSLLNYFDTENKDTLVYFNVAPVKPEKVKTIELGWRASLWQHIYVDADYYYSWYTDFIGYKIGAAVELNPIFGINSYQPYRVSANAQGQVTTTGISVGVNYYFYGSYSFDGNYSYNYLNRHGSTDSLIPAFNTPENKFNLGISGRDVNFRIGKWRTNHFGFSVNYKWVEGYLFQGSPQFTGTIPSYGLIDAQISKVYPKIYLTVKLGASNLLNNYHYEVYGGPAIGRLAYLQLIYSLPVK